MKYTPWLLVTALLALTVSIVLQAVLLGMDASGATGHADGACRPCASSHTDNTTQPSHLSTLATACHLPAAYRAAAYARTWFVLGDEFAAGQGGVTSYIALLQARARALTNANPVVVNAVGADNAQNLPAQVALVRNTAVYRSLVESTQPALVIVSYGAGLLQKQADRGAQDAALSIVEEHLAALTTPTNASLIPAAQSSQFYVLLVAHPDPTYGGISVPAECATCPSLNHPTLASRLAHNEIYSSQRLLYANLAARNQWAWMDTDVALGNYAWPSAANCQASAFVDCYLYSELGQSLLANQVWDCLVQE